MNSLENQPWSKYLKISEKDFQRWKSEGSKDSFIFWSLQEKLINTKDYFDWATEHYQVPLLQDLFFEHYLMTKKEWQDVRELHVWTKEQIPVAVWNNIVFIGCLEPSLLKKDFDFEYRFVLVSSTVLQTMWSFTKGLSQAIVREEEKTLSRLTKEMQQPVIQPKPSLVKKEAQNQSVKTSNPVIQSSLPEPEEERVQEIDNKTFPGRTYEENDNLIMGDFKKKTYDKKIESDKKLEKNRPEETVTTTENSTLYVIKQDDRYEKLWDKTNALFCAAMILKIKRNEAYAAFWSGRMNIRETDQSLVNLDDYSLFKVVQRGYPYHGFVVDTPANKAFFNKLGWTNFPKYVSAVPIRNESKKLCYIFVGLSIKTISKISIQNIEKIIKDFFNSHKKELKIAS